MHSKAFLLLFSSFETINFQYAETALVEKGFTVHKWTSLPTAQELKRVLQNSCQLWVISEDQRALFKMNI